MPARRKWTEQLIEAVAVAQSVAEVRRRIGLKRGASYGHIYRHIARLGLDTSHFKGQGWARAHLKRPEEIRAALLPQLCKGVKVYNLRGRLIASSLKTAQCEECGLTEWRGKPAPLQVDHIDGDHLNNQLENLRILCGNCHMQTETWGFKNGRRRPTQALVA